MGFLTALGEAAPSLCSALVGQISVAAAEDQDEADANTPHVNSTTANRTQQANTNATAGEDLGQIDSSSPFPHPGGEDAHLLWFHQQFGVSISPSQFLYQQRVMLQLFYQSMLSRKRELAHQKALFEEEETRMGIM